MKLPQWGELVDQYCSERSCTGDSGHLVANTRYEEFASRRYNGSPSLDTTSCRLVFLRDVLGDPSNSTLRRKGRFIWCHNLQYAGRGSHGFRQVSFTVDQGQKRFTVGEQNILCIPSKIYVNNNRYFRTHTKTFHVFSTVFGYKNTLRMMSQHQNLSKEDFTKIVSEDNPFRPGTLVAPRRGYFYPDFEPLRKSVRDAQHPCGIILGRAFIDDHIGKEFYRVRFGDTTYERIHPVQMEIINEV